METVLCYMRDYLEKYISLSTTIQFILDHKWTLISTSSVILYGMLFFKRPRNLPPGPYGYPLLGTMPLMMRNFLGNLNTLGEKYGDIFTIWIGMDNYLIVLDSYDVIKEAYVTRGSDFSHRIPGETLHILVVKDTIVSAQYDENYKTSRNIVNQSFRTFISKRFNSVYEREMLLVKEYIKTNGIGENIDLHRPISRVFANIMLLTLFNQHYDHDKEIDDLIVKVNKWFDAFLSTAVVEFLPKMATVLLMSLLKHNKKLTCEMLQVLNKHITECKHRINTDNEVKCVTDAYLTMSKFTTEEISGTILMALPAQFHTAVYACEWVIAYLLHYPHYQEDIYKEIKYIENLNGKKTFSGHDRINMPVTESFIMEVLRLVTIIPLGNFNSPRVDTVLRGYSIPARVRVTAHYDAVHHDPNLFPEPYSFRPERFIKNGKIGNTEGFLPFGTGRRMCIGDGISRNEIFLFIVYMIQNYRMIPASNTLPNLDINLNEFIRKPKPFKVRLELRD